LLDRQIGRLCPVKNLLHITATEPQPRGIRIDPSAVSTSSPQVKSRTACRSIRSTKAPESSANPIAIRSAMARIGWRLSTCSEG
jgi:hypothetical protein